MDPTMMMALSGLMGGGGDTEQTQSASQSTSVNLSSLLMSGGKADAPVSGAASSSGAAQPQPSSALGFPSIGMGSARAADNVRKQAEGGSDNTLLFAGVALAGAVGVAMLFGGGKKRRKKG